MTKSHSTAYERHAPRPELVARSLSESEHRVFWFDEAGAAERYPQLAANIRTDLVIVGGGYLGLWTALLAKLRDPSRDVVVLEAQQVGWAASGRNGGFCEASITHGEENGRSRWPQEYGLLEELGNTNLDSFETDVDRLGIQCQWERTGTLTVAVEKHQIEWLAGQPGYLDAEATRSVVNSPLFLAGDLGNESALVQPARLARELARVASEHGVQIFEGSAAVSLETSASNASVRTKRGSVLADRVVLATNVFSSLLRRNRLRTVPVYDYVLVTEPLSPAQMAEVGWTTRCGLTDMANQFHYSRLTADNRILYGGYDAVYHRGRRVRAEYEDRATTFEQLASHFLATFPQLEDVRFSHRWAGAIDTCTRFAAFYGLARRGRVAYAAGFTGLGVGATRFAAEVLLDLLSGEETPLTQLEMVRRKPVPFPPEPFVSAGINLTRWSLDRADHREGQRNAFLKALDALGLGFDS